MSKYSVKIYTTLTNGRTTLTQFIAESLDDVPSFLEAARQKVVWGEATHVTADATDCYGGGQVYTWNGNDFDVIDF
jgi:hypothetical protein